MWLDRPLKPRPSMQYVHLWQIKWTAISGSQSGFSVRLSSFAPRLPGPGVQRVWARWGKTVPQQDIFTILQIDSFYPGLPTEALIILKSLWKQHSGLSASFLQENWRHFRHQQEPSPSAISGAVTWLPVSLWPVADTAADQAEGNRVRLSCKGFIAFTN